MKQLVLALSFVLVSFSTFAELPAYSITQEIDHSVETLSVSQMDALKSQKNAGCYAYTRCWNGRMIQCQTYGNGCTFYSQPGQYVQCTGYNSWGQWVNTYATCY
ncbi:hypothetical protein [Halobacteriovorax sp. HLS]|uniref:hypothetical protein n=1 Tax=Halobacteriovorax sp. HLS TaxID=2234000 RepID=UPI000FD94E0A|nr:hypothetical protein [Halobacteriovorax sp. HLS]